MSIVLFTLQSLFSMYVGFISYEIVTSVKFKKNTIIAILHFFWAIIVIVNQLITCNRICTNNYNTYSSRMNYYYLL